METLTVVGEHQAAVGQLVQGLDEARQIVDNMAGGISHSERATLQQQLGGLRKQAHAIAVSPLITRPILAGYREDIGRQMMNIGGMAVDLSFEPEVEDARLHELAIASEHMAGLIYRYLEMKGMAEHVREEG